jgi:hypothetical protein
MFVIIDNCATDLLADLGANLIKDLHDTEFVLGCTPDLRTEYENGLLHPAKSEGAKQLIREILREARPYGFFGFGGGPCLGFDQGIWVGPDQYRAIESVKVTENERGLPRKRTDAHLVALAKHALVLTNNFNESHWWRAPEGSGRVIQWSDFLNHWLRARNVASALQAALLQMKPTTPHQELLRIDVDDNPIDHH